MVGIRLFFVFFRCGRPLKDLLIMNEKDLFFLIEIIKFVILHKSSYKGWRKEMK